MNIQTIRNVTEETSIKIDFHLTFSSNHVSVLPFQKVDDYFFNFSFVMAMLSDYCTIITSQFRSFRNEWFTLANKTVLKEESTFYCITTGGYMCFNIAAPAIGNSWYPCWFLLNVKTNPITLVFQDAGLEYGTPAGTIKPECVWIGTPVRTKKCVYHHEIIK